MPHTIAEALNVVEELQGQIKELKEQNERYRKMIKLLVMEAEITD